MDPLSFQAVVKHERSFSAEPEQPYDTVMCPKGDATQFPVDPYHCPCNCATEIATLRSQIESLTSKLSDALQEVASCRKAIGDLKSTNCELTSDLREALLPKKQRTVFNEMQGDDEVTKFYTGFPTWTLFNTVFDLCKPVVKEHHRMALPLEAQFAMTLMKLRLNIKNQDLAYRFHISQSSVSRYFNKWINVMYSRLPSVLLIWPKKSEIEVSIPLSFRHKFKDCVSIIDGFEVFCNRHKNVLDRASTYSNYKSHNTVKFLISITPQGTINFISQGFGGRTSDVEIVKSSGYLDLICTGDVVLADRGFTVEELFGLLGAKLITPSFMGKQDQLSQLQVETSRNISNVRIHVERVIGHLKKTFLILRGPISVDHMTSCDSETSTLVDQIATVRCCLLNCLPGIIPFL